MMAQQPSIKPPQPATPRLIMTPQPQQAPRQGRRGHLTSSDFRGGVFWLEGWSHQCCGLGEMGGIGSAEIFLSTYGEEALLCAMLNAQQLNGHKPWNWMYVLADYQLGMCFHKLMLSLGSIQMGESFMNEAHGPSKLYVFRVNFKKIFDHYDIIEGYEDDKKVYQQLIKKGSKNALNTTIAQTVTAKPHQAAAVPALGG